MILIAIFASTVPSSAPANLSVSPASEGSTSAVVTWNTLPLKDHNGMITGYHIKYFPVNQQVNERTAILGFNTRYTLVNLLPQQKYSIQVAASTSLGVGPYAIVIYETYPAGKLWISNGITNERVN